MAVITTNATQAPYALQGDEEREFSRFFHANFPALARAAFRITRRMEVSEEIAADAMIKLWQRWKGFGHPLAMKAFVYTAARFAVLNYLRDSRRERIARRRYGYFCEKEERFILQDLVNREVCREALCAVHALPSRCRLVFEFIFISGKTPVEIAAAMKVAVSTVRNQKARASALLRRRMENSGNFPVHPDYIFPEL